MLKLTYYMYAIHSLHIALIGECFIVIEGKSCFIELPFMFVGVGEPSFTTNSLPPKMNRRRDIFNGNVPTNDDMSSDELDFIDKE